MSEQTEQPAGAEEPPEREFEFQWWHVAAALYLAAAFATWGTNAGWLMAGAGALLSPTWLAFIRGLPQRWRIAFANVAMLLIGGVLVFAVALLFSVMAPSGYSDADIENVKQSIKAEHETEPGRTVQEVALVRESSRKLTGYIKYTFNGTPIVKNCSATMDQSNRRSLWRCQP